MHVFRFASNGAADETPAHATDLGNGLTPLGVTADRGRANSAVKSVAGKARMSTSGLGGDNTPRVSRASTPTVAYKEDKLGSQLSEKLTWAKKHLAERQLANAQGVYFSLDPRRFLPPELPVRIRLFDPMRIIALKNVFAPTSMTPAIILFIDIDANLKPLGTLWKNIDLDSFSTMFNNVSDVSAEFGEPWVIGGYHSSKALIDLTPSGMPLRQCCLYRLSSVPGDTYSDKLGNARFLSAQDNVSGQSAEGYESQPFLISTYLWREMYLKASSPPRAEKGHHSIEYSAFRFQCVAGDEKLARLYSNEASSLTPRFKIVSLTQDSYDRAFLIMSSMDTRTMIGSNITLERLPNVECEVTILPTDRPSSDEEEEPEEKAKGKGKGKGKPTVTNVRNVTLEDMKDTMRLPPAECDAFLNLVTEHLYVHQVEAFKKQLDSVDSVSFSPKVCEIKQGVWDLKLNRGCEIKQGVGGFN